MQSTQHRVAIAWRNGGCNQPRYLRCQQTYLALEPKDDYNNQCAGDAKGHESPRPSVATLAGQASAGCGGQPKRIAGASHARSG